MLTPTLFNTDIMPNAVTRYHYTNQLLHAYAKHEKPVPDRVRQEFLQAGIEILFCLSPMNGIPKVLTDSLAETK